MVLITQGYKLIAPNAVVLILAFDFPIPVQTAFPVLEHHRLKNE